MEQQVQRRVKTKVEKFITIAIKGVFGIIAVIAFALLVGYGVMLLWNWLLPDIFGVTTINYWQAVGILVLVKVLFGGFGGRNPRKNNPRSRSHWKTKMPRSCKSDVSTWKYYDRFWEDEGKNAYETYIARVENRENE